MGKGNRSRIERAMNESANVNKTVKAKNNKVSGAGIFVAIAALLVVIALLTGAVSMINQGGWFARVQTVVQVEDYRVTGTMMNYFFNTQVNSYYQTYYQFYQQLGSSSSTDISSLVYKQMGISDPSKSWKQQNMPEVEGAEPVTVFDYYMGLTEDYVTQMLTYCVFAGKEGIALTEEDHENIAKSIDSMKESYKSQKAMYEQFGMSYYATFSAYLAATYGTGVNETDVRECLELITLAAKFEEKIRDEKEAELLADETKEAIEKYVKENPSKFLMADYYSYTFTVNSKSYENDADFEAAKKDILEQAKALAGVEGKDAFKAAVLELLKEGELKTYREKNWSTFLKDNDNDEARAEEALVKSFNEKIWTESMQTVKYDAKKTEAFKYPATATDLSKWIFGFDAGEHTEDCDHEGEHEESQEAAEEGDITYFEKEETKTETITSGTTTAGTTAGTTEAESTTDGAAPAAETTTEAESTTAGEGTTGASSSTSNKKEVTYYTVTVYMLDKTAYRNTEITKHFGYVMFSEKADAEAFLTEYTKGETNKDTMIEVLEKMYEENNKLSVYAYDAVEDYLPGDLQDQKVDGADKWLETAKPGTHSDVVELKVTTTSSSSSSTASKDPKTYYAVLVYDKDGYEYWFNDALDGARDVAVQEWFEENTLELTYNEKVYNFIDQ